jgi:2-aminoethylphosphonate-pyruvate transaminase
MSGVNTAVILAAGRGTRLQGTFSEQPKGFLPLAGVPIVEQSIRKLLASGITRIVIGTGHLSEAYEALAARYPGITCVRNDAYATTGSLCTLANLAQHLDRDFLLLESDLVYEARSLAVLLAETRPDVILASGRTNSGDEVYVEADETGRLVAVSKDASRLGGIHGELVGISKLSLATYRALCARAAGRSKLDYEQGLAGISTERPVFVHRVDDLAWSEIDDETHLKRALADVFPEIQKREATKVTRNILLNPGPATTTDTVKQAQVVPDICPREEEFGCLVREIRASLVRIAGGGSDYTAVLFGGSGTAVMDAVVNSVVPAGRKLAVIVNGAYGQRLVAIARAYNIACVEIEFPWGTRIDVDVVRARLASERDVACVAMIHHETTTGILNPIREVGQICASGGCRFIVDAISSYAGMPLDVNDVQVDFLLGTSNKCLQGMAGLAFAICRKAALEAIKAQPKRSYYLDLYSQYAALERTGQFAFTPPVSVVYALQQAIAEFDREGAATRHARYAESYRTLKDGLLALGFRLLLDTPDESGILLTVLEPDDERYDFARMHDWFLQRGFTLYPGKLTGARTFRLSILGAIDAGDIRRFLHLLGEFLAAEDIRLTYADHSVPALA